MRDWLAARRLWVWLAALAWWPVALARRPGVLGRRPAVSARRPVALARRPGALARRPGVLGRRPAVLARRPGVLARRSAVSARHPAALARQPAARLALERRRALLELALYGGGYLIYLLSRGLFYSDPRAVGIVNGERVAGWQDRLGLLWEPGWQAWAVEHVPGIVVFLNWAYIVTYWPVILGLALFLFLRDRPRYYYYRTVILLNLAVAMTVFAVFPMASPFALPGVDLTDTIQAFGPRLYGSETMAPFYNQTAAMPSLHFSWTVILGVCWWSRLRGGFKAVGLLYPAMTFFAITITGNHFILDAVAGGVLAGLSFGVVELWRRTAARRRAGGGTPPP